MGGKVVCVRVSVSVCVCVCVWRGLVCVCERESGREVCVTASVAK